ncbi:hypothetical protein U1Q18_036927 [Sarracenia purpurea var. burkii]
MAGETQKTGAPEAPVTEEEVVVSAVPVAEKELPPVPEPVAEETQKKAAAVVEEGVEAEKPKPAVPEEEAKIIESASFKEETNVAGELPDPHKKALDELKQLVQEALNKHEFAVPPPPPAKEEEKKAEEAATEEEEVKAHVPATEEEPKPEEKKIEDPAETPALAAADVPPPPAAEGPPKPEPETTAPSAPTKEEEKAPPPPPHAAETSEPPPVVVPELVEKVTASVDEDGAKTVEAIEETIVAVSPPGPPPSEPAPSTEAPPAEPTEPETPAPPPPPPEEVSIWGIPLLADERSDVILLKFLRARDFKVKDAFSLLRNTVRWRKDFGIESLLEEELDTELDKIVFLHGFDKEGHTVCYNAYGEFQNKELYQNTFSDEEKRQKFLRWRIQFLEKSIRKLDFYPDGINTFVQINDLKNSPGPFKRELWTATNHALQLLQDNYPEFVAKQVFINVPWWYLAFYRMISPFLTQRTKSKFVFAGPSKSAETLFKYIAPEQVPAQYGGLSREGEQEFTTADPVTEETIKPASKHVVEFPVSEGSSLVWEVRVVGWDLFHGAEFVPNAEGGYTVIIQKSRKIVPADETVVSGIYKIGEPGKVVLTFNNQTSKKKKLLYRSKTKSSD